MNAAKARDIAKKSRDFVLMKRALVYIRKGARKGWTQVEVPATIGEQLSDCTLLVNAGYKLQTIRVEGKGGESTSYFISWSG